VIRLHLGVKWRFSERREVEKVSLCATLKLGKRGPLSPHPICWREQFPSAPRPSEQEEIVTQRYSRRAWSVLIVVGSILAAAAIWALPEYEARAR
jgi:hypothetical protein